MDTMITWFLIEDRLAELRRAADDERLIRSARVPGAPAAGSPATLAAPPAGAARPTIHGR